MSDDKQQQAYKQQQEQRFRDQQQQAQRFRDQERLSHQKAEHRERMERRYETQQRIEYFRPQTYPSKASSPISSFRLFAVLALLIFIGYCAFRLFR